MRTSLHLLLACSALLSGTAARSHVVLQEPAAAAGSSYRAAFQIAHGCAGAATTAVRVRLPAGFEGAKPMPKAGWSLQSNASEVVWTANSAEAALPDAWYDEFVLRGTTPRQAGLLWFKVLQTCTQGQTDWSEVPATGSSIQGLKAPAALLEVIDTGATGHQH